MYNQYDKIAYDSIDFEEMQAETQSIARDILENVSVLNDSIAGLDDNTMQDLKFYRYGDALLLKLSEAMK